MIVIHWTNSLSFNLVQINKEKVIQKKLLSPQKLGEIEVNRQYQMCTRMQSGGGTMLSSFDAPKGQPTHWPAFFSYAYRSKKVEVNSGIGLL